MIANRNRIVSTACCRRRRVFLTDRESRYYLLVSEQAYLHHSTHALGMMRPGNVYSYPILLRIRSMNGNDHQVVFGLVGVGTGVTLFVSSCIFILSAIESATRDELLG